MNKRSRSNRKIDRKIHDNFPKRNQHPRTTKPQLIQPTSIFSRLTIAQLRQVANLKKRKPNLTQPHSERLSLRIRRFSTFFHFCLIMDSSRVRCNRLHCIFYLHCIFLVSSAFRNRMGNVGKQQFVQTKYLRTRLAGIEHAMPHILRNLCGSQFFFGVLNKCF